MKQKSSTKRIANPDLADAIVRRVYADALRLDWLHLRPSTRTEQYQKWLDDKNVGGELQQWMSHRAASTWLKDIAIKELARALAGVGDFARLLSVHPWSAKVIVDRALGVNWSVVEGTTQPKPMSVVARDGTGNEFRIYWGSQKDFKHLLWAALTVWERTKAEGTIVVFDTVEGPVSKSRQDRMRRLAIRAGFGVKFIRVDSPPRVDPALEAP